MVVPPSRPDRYTLITGTRSANPPDLRRLSALVDASATTDELQSPVEQIRRTLLST